MSDVDEDLEFYTALEDELYKESESNYSDDEIDSELEAELYQSVHFASSLVVNSSKNCQDAVIPPCGKSNLSDLSNEDITSESPGNISEFDADGPDSKLISLLDGNCVTTEYPEVEPVFSSERKIQKDFNRKRDVATILGLVQSTDVDENSAESSFTPNEGWELIEADFKEISTTTRKRYKPKSFYIRCFNCNERGHRTFECTQPKKDKICYLCGMTGHLKQDCPQELCFNCLEPGHQLRQCRKPRCRPGDMCQRCHAYGHFESLCPDKWRQYHLTIKPGHIVQPFSLKPLALKNKVYCYNCGSEGHLGHECFEDTSGGRLAPAFPFVVKYDRFTIPSASRNTTVDLRKNRSPRGNPYQFRNQHHSDRSDCERPSKRRKIRDHWGYEGEREDRNWHSSMDDRTMSGELTDSWNSQGLRDMVKTATGVDGNHPDIKPGTKRKRKKKKNKPKKEQETIQVTITEDRGKNGKKKKRKIKRNLQVEMSKDQPVERYSLVDTWNAATNKKKKKNKKKAKVAQNNPQLITISHTSSPTFETKNPSGSTAKKDSKRNQNSQGHPHRTKKGKKSRRKTTRSQPSKGNVSRTVYHDFNGFV